jgi:hypothetical protein
MPVRKNQALNVPFALVNAADGSPVTGASPAAYRSLDGASQSVGTGPVVELGSGQYVFQGQVADFNADYTVGLLFTAANAVPAHILLQIRYFRKGVAYNIPFCLIDVRNGSALVGASPSGIRCLDGGAQGVIGGSFAELGNGQYVFRASVEDFGADYIAAFLITAANAVPIHLGIDLLELYNFGGFAVVSPASVLATYLIEQGVVTTPTSDDWPIYVSSLPHAPDDLVAAYDTTPVKDARTMLGPVVQHYGVSFTVRAVDYVEGWSKIQSIAMALDSIIRSTVVCGASTYFIQAVSRTSGPTSLGREEGTKRRVLYSLNVIASINQV